MLRTTYESKLSPNDMNASNTSRTVWLRALLLSAFILIFLGAWLFYGVTIDDAYISARYAKNLVEGNGLTFNPGVRVEGYSNPSWVFLTGGLATIFGADALPQIGRICGIAATLLAMALSALTLRRLSCGQLSIGLSLLLLALLPQTSFWSVAGLETSLYGLLLLTSAVTAAGNGWLSGVTTALGALTRPEGAAFLVSNMVGRIDSGINWSGNLRRAGLYMLAFLVIFAPYILFRIGYFEALTPNTYLVKAGGSNKLAQGIWYIRNNITIGGYVLILLALPAVFMAPRNITIRCLTFGMLVELAFTAWAGGDWMPLGRFLVPVFFLATPLAGFTLNDFAKRAETFSITRAGLVATMVGMVLVGIQAREFQRGYDKYFWRIAHGLDSRKAFGQWLHNQSLGELTIAYGDMGALPFFSGNRFIDFHGLVDREIATIRFSNKNREDYLRLIDENVLSRAPDVIVVLSEDDPQAGTWHMSEYGTDTLKRGLAERYSLQGFLSAYPAGFAKEYPHGRHLVIYVRRGTVIPGLQDFLTCSNARLPENKVSSCARGLLS
jgi:arabinofuranosyltransferase